MLKTAKIIAAVALFQTMLTAPAWSLEVGQPAPDFGTRTLTGEPVSRASLAGKPALLVFWNTWCSTCKKELPQVNKVAQQYAAKGVAILAINTGLNDSEAKAGAFWKKNRFVFPSAFDRSFDISESFGVQGVPTVVLVDAGGTVRYKGTELPANLDEQLRLMARK